MTASLLLLVIFLTTIPTTIESREENRQTYSLSEAIPEYRLGFGDVIEVKFFHNPRFNEIITVRPDGRISMERIGEIFVTGMTALQLDKLITDKYSIFVQEPEVTVFVREFAGYQVYVLGQVNSPGGYTIQRDMTMLQAVAMAGGAMDGAKMQSVMLLRRGEDGEVKAFKVDLKNPVNGSEGKVIEDDLYVQALDIVYVPKTFFASANTFMTQVWGGFLPPVDVYLRVLWWRDFRRD
jgi:protein involved in polysaccharide export with SLBB domain